MKECACVYACVCVHVCVCVHAHVCVHVCVCVGQRSTSDMIPQNNTHLLGRFMQRQDLPLAYNSQILQGWLSRKRDTGSSYLCLASTGMIRVHRLA